jgi:recombination protein RecT
MTSSTSLTDKLKDTKAAQEAGLAAPGQQKGLSVYGWLNDPTTGAELARALPRGMDAGRFSRIVQTEVRKNPELLKTTPPSFILAVLNAAQLGLEPGPLGHSYLIPFKNHGVLETTLILGYKGLKDLAYRGGAEYIDAVSVHEGEPFKIVRGSDPHIEHEERAECADKPVIAYYAIAIPRSYEAPLKERAVFEVMWPKDIDGIRKRSRAGDKGPWVTDFEAMALKTVIRRMLNRGKVRLTVDVATAIQEDEARELGFERPEVLADLTPLPPAAAEGEAPAAEAITEQRGEVDGAQTTITRHVPTADFPERPKDGATHTDAEGVIWEFSRGNWYEKKPDLAASEGTLPLGQS